MYGSLGAFKLKHSWCKRKEWLMYPFTAVLNFDVDISSPPCEPPVAVSQWKGWQRRQKCQKQNLFTYCQKSVVVLYWCCFKVVQGKLICRFYEVHVSSDRFRNLIWTTVCVVRAECESVSVWHCYPCNSDKCSKVIDTNLYKAVFSNIYTANCMFNGSLETSKSQSSRSFSSIFRSIVEDEKLIFLNTDNFFSIA